MGLTETATFLPQKLPLPLETWRAELGTGTTPVHKMLSSVIKICQKKLGFFQGTAFNQLNQHNVIMCHFIYFKPKLTSVTETQLSFCKLTMRYDFTAEVTLRSTYVQKKKKKKLQPSKWNTCYASLASLSLIEELLHAFLSPSPVPSFPTHPKGCTGNPLEHDAIAALAVTGRHWVQWKPGSCWVGNISSALLPPSACLLQVSILCSSTSRWLQKLPYSSNLSPYCFLFHVLFFCCFQLDNE